MLDQVADYVTPGDRDIIVKTTFDARLQADAEDAIRKALAESAEKCGQVDILLNACGGNRGKCPLVEQKMEDYDFVLKLNLLAGCFTPMKVFGDYWIKNT